MRQVHKRLVPDAAVDIGLINGTSSDCERVFTDAEMK